MNGTKAKTGTDQGKRKPSDGKRPPREKEERKHSSQEGTIKGMTQ